MALKAFVDSLEGVPEGLRSEYQEVEEGGKKLFRLAIDGGFLDREDPSVLKRTIEHVRGEKKSAETKAKEYEARVAALEEDREKRLAGAIPKADFESLKTSVEERAGKLVKSAEEKAGKAVGTVRNLLVTNRAQALATKLAATGEDAEVLTPFIERRLAVEETDDGYVTRVLGTDGKPSVMTLDELEKEIRADKRFGKLIAGSRATGGGAGGTPGGAGGGRRDFGKDFDPLKASPADVAAWAASRAAARKT